VHSAFFSLSGILTKQDVPKGVMKPVSSSSSLRTLIWRYPENMSRSVTPDFPKKTKCISYVRQDHVYTHMIDIMSEISINSNKNIQELNHYIISLLHSDVRLEGLYNDQTITMKM
jgi:hypothetical protein